MISYELAKKLKEAGFSQSGKNHFYINRPDHDHFVVELIKDEFGNDVFTTDPGDPCYVPLLEELIEVCGDDFSTLFRLPARMSKEAKKPWCATSQSITSIGQENPTLGDTPEEAVANLWLALNKK